MPEESDGEGGMGWGGNGTVEAVRAGDALISLNFSPPFISDEGADVIALASMSLSSLRPARTDSVELQITQIISGDSLGENTSG